MTKSLEMLIELTAIKMAETRPGEICKRCKAEVSESRKLIATKRALIDSLIYHGFNPDLAKNNCLLTREFVFVIVVDNWSG